VAAPARDGLRRLPVAAKEPLPKVEWHDGLEAIGTHVAARLPNGAVMAASEVGILGSRGRGVTLIDLVGLNDTTIGRRGFSMDYLLSRKPDFIWLPHGDYTGLRALILSDQRLFEHYDVYAGAFTYGIAIRRNGPHRAAVEVAVRNAWEQVYPGREMASHRVVR